MMFVENCYNLMLLAHSAWTEKGVKQTDPSSFTPCKCNWFVLSYTHFDTHLKRKSFLLNLPFFPELKNCCMCFLHHAKIYRLQTLKASSDHLVCNLKDLQITDLKKLHGGHVVCNICCKVFCMKLAILVDEFKTCRCQWPIIITTFTKSKGDEYWSPVSNIIKLQSFMKPLCY